MAYVRLFFRGFVQVALVSANVAQIAAGHYSGAFFIGTAISVVWYSNTRTANRVELPGAAACYGLGAGAGTVVGMALARSLFL